MIQVPHGSASAYRDARLRAPHLVSLAVTPSGEGPYVEAIRDWIEQITPRPVGMPLLRLVR